MNVWTTSTNQTEEWRYWIALRMVRGVGNVTYRELLAHFGSPEAALKAETDALITVGVHKEVARAITAFDQWRAVDTEIRNLIKAGVRLVTRLSPDYPENLTHLHDPPPFLYVRGSLTPTDRLAIASRFTVRQRLWARS